MLYTVILDYDHHPFSFIVKDVQRLIKRYRLKSAKIYVSSKRDKPYHYHVYFERKVHSIDDFREIISNSNCCENYKEYAQTYPFTIIRIRGTKPKPYLYAVVYQKKVEKKRN